MSTIYLDKLKGLRLIQQQLYDEDFNKSNINFLNKLLKTKIITEDNVDEFLPTAHMKIRDAIAHYSKKKK